MMQLYDNERLLKKFRSGQRRVPPSIEAMRKMRPDADECWNCQRPFWDDDGQSLVGYCSDRDMCIDVNARGECLTTNNDQRICPCREMRRLP